MLDQGQGSSIVCKCRKSQLKIPKLMLVARRFRFCRVWLVLLPPRVTISVGRLTYLSLENDSLDWKLADDTESSFRVAVASMMTTTKTDDNNSQAKTKQRKIRLVLPATPEVATNYFVIASRNLYTEQE